MPELRASYGGTRELGRWLAFLDEWSPYDELWQMTASICCALYRAAGDKRAQPNHFLPKRMKGARDTSPEALAAKFRAVLGAASEDNQAKAPAKRKRA